MRLQPITLPESVDSHTAYAIRNFCPGDEPAWLEVLQSGGFDPWDRSRLDRLIAGERTPLPPSAIFFATHKNRPIGAANIFSYPSDGQTAAELGWVAVHPDHRGHGLAYRLGREAICYAQEQKYACVFLETEDFRLAAIKTYLKLGFMPELRSPDHRSRWKIVRDRVGLP